jgi:hypothetical protein
MVGHLEHVQPVAITLDAHRQQPWVDVILDIAGEQQSALAEPEVDYHRCVIDASPLRG